MDAKQKLNSAPILILIERRHFFHLTHFQIQKLYRLDNFRFPTSPFCYILYLYEL